MSNIAFIPLLLTQVDLFKLAKIKTKAKNTFIFIMFIQVFFSLVLIDLYILLDFFQLLFFIFPAVYCN